MTDDVSLAEHDHISAFEKIRRVNDAGNEYWSSRDLAGVLGYGQYRNFEPVLEKAKTACFNSGQRVEDHFADMRKMIEIGKGGVRAVSDIFLSRYACYLIVQNADPSKPVVATGQTYSARKCAAPSRSSAGRCRRTCRRQPKAPSSSNRSGKSWRPGKQSKHRRRNSSSLAWKSGG